MKELSLYEVLSRFLFGCWRRSHSSEEADQLEGHKNDCENVVPNPVQIRIYNDIQIPRFELRGSSFKDQRHIWIRLQWKKTYQEREAKICNHWHKENPCKSLDESRNFCESTWRGTERQKDAAEIFWEKRKNNTSQRVLWKKRKIFAFTISCGEQSIRKHRAMEVSKEESLKKSLTWMKEYFSLIFLHTCQAEETKKVANAGSWSRASREPAGGEGTRK